MITNYLSPVSFTVTIERLKNVEFFTQRFTIPTVSNVPVQQVSPRMNLFATSDRLDYGELDLSFIVDENMNNYNEVLRWMEGMGSPQSTEQYADLKRNKFGIVSDITVIVQSSNRQPNIEFNFKNCFPTSLSAIALDVTANDIIYPECTVSFRYDTFEFKNFS